MAIQMGIRGKFICLRVGQNSDGYGEGFEQRPIKTPDGEIYVSFWDSENYSMKLEQEMKNSSPDLGYGGQVMG